MTTPLDEQPADPASFDFGTLAFIVGAGFNDAVTARLHAAGFPEVRLSFGYVVQHLVAGPKSATELAALLGISQQAATKRIGEMLDCGLLREADHADRRRRAVALSECGLAMLATARALRAEVAAAMLAAAAPSDVETARRVLLGAIDALEMAQTVRARRLREDGPAAATRE